MKSGKRSSVAIVGLGYVGLPLALEFAKKGSNVLGIELDKDRLRQVNKGVSYITDVPSSHLRSVITSGRFKAEGDFGSLKDYDTVIICVPTPLKRKCDPDISFIIAAVKEVKKHLRMGHLVVLESTTYPGTTQEVILPLLESSGLRCGKDFYLAFSPERIDPGNVRFPVNKIPKVVGGNDARSTAMAVSVYSRIIDKVVPVSSSRVAETVKLLENTFRIVNIGLIDEIAMMCHKMNINIWEVVSAASTKPFGFMPFYPGPGVGGHCIPKDPLYLYWKAKKFGFESRFIKLSSELITSMPGYIVERVAAGLRKTAKPLSKAKVLVVGVTYKKDIKDLRKSPSIDIIEILQQKKAGVSYHDPLIPFLKLGGIDLKSTGIGARSLKAFDCVIIATDHSNVDYGMILKGSRLVFDARNVYKGKASSNLITL